jgi:hypothetical protein
MEIYVIPVGRDVYELYCEPTIDEGTGEDEAPAGTWLARLQRQFSEMIRAAESRPREADDRSQSWSRRLRTRVLRWVAQRIAEQRLLWNLRRHTVASAAYPSDMPFEQALRFVRGALQRDYERHRRWLVIDSAGLVASGPIAVVPGPNLVAYFFAFRVFGHWLSMRGATQGLRRVEWSGQPCAPLVELRHLARLTPAERDARIRDVAERLQLPHLTAFIARVTVRHA